MASRRSAPSCRRGEAGPRARRARHGPERRARHGGPRVDGGVRALRRRTCRTRSHSSPTASFRGSCNKGLTVAEVSPESAVGGPLGARGERRPDHDRRRPAALDLEVDEKTLTARRAKLRRRQRCKKSTGWLSIYQRRCSRCPRASCSSATFDRYETHYRLNFIRYSVPKSAAPICTGRPIPSSWRQSRVRWPSTPSSCCATNRSATRSRFASAAHSGRSSCRRTWG